MYPVPIPGEAHVFGGPRLRGPRSLPSASGWRAVQRFTIGLGEYAETEPVGGRPVSLDTRYESRQALMRLETIDRRPDG